jgi:RNA polymerase sigma-70 factor (ECF subfamily)
MLANARRRVDADTAEDVVADALLVLWRRRHELARRDGVSADARDAEVAWAIGITRGCLANSRRSARRRLALVGRLAGLERPSAGYSAPSIEGDEQIHAALGSLRKEDQELLRLWAPLEPGDGRRVRDGVRVGEGIGVTRARVTSG